MSTAALMSPQDLDAMAFGAGPAVDRRPEIARAIEACYLPLRQAGYSPRDARWAVAGFLASAWGDIYVVESEAAAIALACGVAEGRVGGEA
jgi:hypothetical protein